MQGFIILKGLPPLHRRVQPPHIMGNKFYGRPRRFVNHGAQANRNVLTGSPGSVDAETRLWSVVKPPWDGIRHQKNPGKKTVRPGIRVEKEKGNKMKGVGLGESPKMQLTCNQKEAG